MSTIQWIGLTAIVVVVVYLLVMRVFFQRSREADKHIDYRKIREWKDEDK